MKTLRQPQETICKLKRNSCFELDCLPSAIRQSQRKTGRAPNRFLDSIEVKGRRSEQRCHSVQRRAQVEKQFGEYQTPWQNQYKLGTDAPKVIYPNLVQPKELRRHSIVFGQTTRDRTVDLSKVNTDVKKEFLDLDRAYE